MKSLDGLMRYLAEHLSTAQYEALARIAAAQGLGVRDYVGRRVLKMVEEQAAQRVTRVSASAAGVIVVAPEKAAVLR